MSSFDKVLAEQERMIAAKAEESKGEVGRHVPFERTRRITGYLVGGLHRFNNAKRCEERDRMKHG